MDSKQRRSRKLRVAVEIETFARLKPSHSVLSTCRYVQYIQIEGLPSLFDSFFFYLRISMRAGGVIAAVLRVLVQFASLFAIMFVQILTYYQAIC